MQKRSSKSESTWKTEQNRSCWKILTMVKVNGQRSGQGQWSTIWSRSTVNEWRVLTCRTQSAVGAWGTWVSVGTGAWGAWRILTACGDAWSACSWGRNFSQRVEARVMHFLAVLGWVLLKIGCSVFLCLLFGSWMRRTLISECCRYCKRDDGGSLLTVTTGWRRGQQKNAEDVHKNQKVREMVLIPC